MQSQNEVYLSAIVVKTEKCEWTRWSQWSACTVSCGMGEKLRKRRCSCGIDDLYVLLACANDQICLPVYSFLPLSMYLT
ncbi:unnamed protein product [Strongylus vulgaris]|uniref:CCN TSP1 domain-containing protein n=1 Tax=Strongylus vulgaris TaxID=40348 RepID=A0A3P7IRJ1_STRVU|nr:unnamed protein product [Strongylus vulgaris]